MQKSRYGYGASVVLAAALALSACSGSGSDTESTVTSTVTSTPAAAATTTGSASAESHNDADIAFAQGMIPHHQQAIVMSDMMLAKEGIDPDVESLANQIKSAQAPEIEQMRGWLDQWGAGNTMPGHDMPGNQMPGMDDMPGMTDMPGMGDMPGMADMPGMMSGADMAALQNAQGADASRLFLTQMIRHHEGAITMAQQEIDNGQAPAAVELARNIITSQQQEITTMQQMLDAM